MARAAWTGMLPGRPFAALSFPSHKSGYFFLKAGATRAVANSSSAAATQASSERASVEPASFRDQQNSSTPFHEPLVHKTQKLPSSCGCTLSKKPEAGETGRGRKDLVTPEAEFASDNRRESSGHTSFPYPRVEPRSCFSAADSEAFRRRWKTANQLPFFVRRTASDNVPVYLHWSNNRNKVSTIIRKVHGHKQILKSELAVLCEAPVIEKEGWLEVRGNHKKVVKEWLKQIGY
uniref:Large ribosomal subunit protein mL49 n=1 Tax=Neospora caninum (strain Liverpool) TaxID=572307 RepID=A0A0F7UG81_NEOCL|nr:TPA: Mitochondrial ribosomal protein L49/IMG2,putative [Neospora caninum Liverpool]